MSDVRIGPWARSVFGNHEKGIAEAYRRLFVDLDVLVTRLRSSVAAEDILEVGCGEGMLTERLARAYPAARITGIDVTSRVGRLFAADRTRVSFRQQTVESLAEESPASFDLIVVCDVLHHIALPQRPGVLGSVRRLLRAGGSVVIKEWERRHNLIHLLGHLSDRWLTGDCVQYTRFDELRESIEGAFGALAHVDELRLPPWRNNVALVVRPR